MWVCNSGQGGQGGRADTGGARRSEGKGQEVRASGHDDNMTIAQLRSSRRRRCHVAVAACERKSVQAGASVNEWSRPQHDDHAVAIVMLLLSPRGCCERVGVGRLRGRREGKGRGNVRASVHIVVVPMWLLRGQGPG
jgi:hypothetical protein